MQVQGTHVGGSTGQKILSASDLYILSQNLNGFKTEISDATYNAAKSINELTKLQLMQSYEAASANNKKVVNDLHLIVNTLAKYRENTERMVEATQKLISTHRDILDKSVRR